MDQVATPDTRASRPLAVVGVVAALIVVVAFVAVAMQQRTVPFTTAGWEKGRGHFAKDNPRVRMQDEALSRLKWRHLTMSQVTDLLGPSDEPIFVQDPTGGMGNIGTSPGQQTLVYVVGIRPKSLLRGRALQLLVTFFDKRNNLLGAYLDPMDFPAGSKVVPAIALDGGRTMKVKPGGKVITVP